MAILDPFKLRFEGRTAGADETGVYQYKRTYQGIITPEDTDEGEILDLAIAQLPGVHPANAFAYLRGVEARQVAKRPDYWFFDCLWKTGGSDTSLVNPLLERAKVSGGSSRQQTVTNTDRDGKPIVNAVGDPLLHEYFDAEGELQITKNVASFDPILAQEYRNAVISTTAIGFPPRTLRIAGFNYTEESRNGIDFIRLTVTFAIAGPPFYVWEPCYVPHVGNRSLTRDDTLARLVDDAGNPLEYAFLSQADVPIEDQDSSDPTKGKGGYAWYRAKSGKSRPVPPNFLVTGMYPLVPFDALGIWP